MATPVPKEPSYTYTATLLRVIDADTVIVKVQCGFYIELEVKLRLYGINAPELNTTAGKAARDYLKTQLIPGRKYIIKTFKDPEDKYGRWLAKVYSGIVCVNEDLIKKGHAVEYYLK